MHFEKIIWCDSGRLREKKTDFFYNILYGTSDCAVVFVAGILVRWSECRKIGHWENNGNLRLINCLLRTWISVIILISDTWKMRDKQRYHEKWKENKRPKLCMWPCPDYIAPVFSIFTIDSRHIKLISTKFIPRPKWKKQVERIHTKNELKHSKTKERMKYEQR